MWWPAAMRQSLHILRSSTFAKQQILTNLKAYTMKKILLTIAILMTMAFSANAQCDVFFNWNDADNETNRYVGDDFSFNLPAAHGSEYDYNAPLGNGLLVLTALGVGYAIKKKH
jgi:hypothetical protein